MRRFALSFGLGLLLIVPRLAPAQDSGDKPVVVPFELLPSGHMAVMVKINDKGPYRLIFDTGAPTVLLNTNIALKTGVIKEKKMSLMFGNQGSANIKRLQVGGQKADDVPAVVMDHPTVEAISKAFSGPQANGDWPWKMAPSIDGIVGFPFFARFKVTLDYQAKTLTLVPNGYNPPDVMKGMEALLVDMMSGKPKPPVVLSPAGQWGLVTAKAPTDEAAGVDIKVVRPGSPAALAGLKAGDRLLTLDGRWTDSVPDVYAAASYVKADTSVPVKVLRGGKELILKVKPTSGL
jgi:hypothetical protein